jgi:cardiolipin synthase
MIIDHEWTSVGSANFDNRSFRLNDEANLNVLDSRMAQEESANFERDKSQARAFTYEDWLNRTWREKLTDKAAALLRSQL